MIYHAGPWTDDRVVQGKCRGEVAFDSLPVVPFT